MKIKLLKVLKSKIVKNAGWMIGEKILQMLISLVVSLLTARYLGPANYGLINYAASFTAFFASFCTLGINSLMVKELVDRPEAEGEILGTVLLMRIASSFLSALTMICIVSVIDRGESETILVVCLCSVGMVFQVFDAFRYWFQRHLRSKFTAIATLVAYIATAIYRIVLIVSGAEVTLFALVTSVDYIVLAFFLVIFYKQNGGKRLRFSWKYGKQLLSRSKHFILAGLMVSVYAQTDKLMLKQMLDVTQTGYYATATAINTMWCFVLAAVIDSFHPSIMEAHKLGDDQLFKKRNRQLYAIVFYLSVVVATLFNLLAELIIYILYGAAYLPAAVPLRVISWHTAFSYLGVARNAWIVSKNQQKHLLKLYVTAAIGNVVLNWILIPVWGASGAALASLFSQIMTGFLLPFFVKELYPNAQLMLEGILLKGVFEKKKCS